MRDHVEQHPSGVSVCKHCGGEVAEDGYSAGGLVMESEGEAMREGDTDDAPQQGEATFAQALRQRGVR